MKIETLLGIDGYSLIVCHCYGNLYRLSIIDRQHNTYNSEGIYLTLEVAIERGKLIVQNLSYFQHKNTSSQPSHGISN